MGPSVIPLGFTPVYGYLALMGNLGSIALTLLLSGGMLLVAVGLWGATLLGLPGNWGMLIAAVIYDWLVADGSPRELGVKMIVALAVMAAIGEAVEFAAGAFGVRRKGGSALSASLALVGSIGGGLAGAVIGIPIPVIGSVLGVVLGSSAGAMVGAIVGEDLRGRDPIQSMDVGWAAFWGRLMGTLGKTLIGAIMVAVIIVGMCF